MARYARLETWALESHFGEESASVRRIAIIASSRYPIAQPFAGGLEAHVWSLTRALTRRGHQVVLFAAAGSDPELNVELLPVAEFELSPLSPS